MVLVEIKRSKDTRWCQTAQCEISRGANWWSEESLLSIDLCLMLSRRFLVGYLAVFAEKWEHTRSEDESQQVRGESEAFSVEFICKETEKHSELKILCLLVHQDNHVKCKLCENVDAYGENRRGTWESELWIMEGRRAARQGHRGAILKQMMGSNSC